MLDHTVELIETPPALEALAGRIACASAVAVDIETVNWWDREAERVALLQLAFREGDRPCVAVVDTLAALDLAPLRGPLAASPTPKAIHNASYDAVRLLRHHQIHTAPIHDTMLAARRSGDRRWSLKAQVEIYLGIQLDKTEQRSDWGRRPLTREQLRYAALDAACTLLLYERQIERGLRGDYYLRARTLEEQSALPLGPTPAVDPAPRISIVPDLATVPIDAELNAAALALLGIVCELSGRYSPEQLAASVGAERVGLAGWIVDRALGAEADIDEGTARGEIARLKDDGLITINLTRRLEATPRGVRLWQRNKNSIN